ncbi:S8 family serine peptidase [Marinobacterium rhizophilum]|uniref:S8 family serine peptidase n=1 Tax=Marinobacterium rhizophilum TaxID=420402 RepID=A0ABY5HMK7_9GAMM|nr:S8 family serine peptidase [Marinobacterium rhizophilum]UTW13540.1 S8 family serine peptidase [Marinobacterium rhizophilum]
MPHLIALSVALLMFLTQAGQVLALPSHDPARVHSSPPPTFAPDRILVRFKPGSAAAEMASLAREGRDRHLRTIPGLDVHVLQVPAGTVLDRVALYQRNPNVLFAQADAYRILTIPNEGQDPPGGAINDYFAEQWALNNTGQVHTYPDPLIGAVPVTGSPDADIDAPEAWDLYQGNPAVKIAILDTGVDCRDVATNPQGSIEFDTATGKCSEQVSFVEQYSPTVLDVVGHGSHVAGIAAAQTDNDIGIAGVGWHSSVGSLKACFEYAYYPFPGIDYYVIVGVCPVSASAAAITYAADQGYHVINMSYASDLVDADGEPAGIGGANPAEASAVAYAWSKGAVLVAAAGNGNDTALVYPAAYPEVIAVGATDRYDDRASFSTFGNNWVSLLAPGDNIISTIQNDLCIFYAEILGLFFDPDNDACLDWFSGTSMASPHVAGAAALVWGYLFETQLGDPQLCSDAQGAGCNQVVRTMLEGGADTTGALGQNMLAWSQHGRLNLYGALTAVSEPPPPPAEGPMAGFSYACNRLQCDFSNLSSGTGALAFAWEFGDGGDSADTSPTHSYAAPGVYTVELTVTDMLANTDVISLPVEVKRRGKSSGTTDGVPDPGGTCTDADGDGVCVEDGDCDDSNADVYPGFNEKGRRRNDGLDNDCNGEVDA